MSKTIDPPRPPRPEPRGPDPTWIRPKEPWEVTLERFAAGFIVMLVLIAAVALTVAWVWTLPAVALFVAACWLIGRLLIRA